MTRLTLLSLGAGVQSTTLALMACDGTLPGLDGAIFADTGWEPAAVYAHLDRIEAVLTRAGIPLYRVSSGNLRHDTLNPTHRYASIPWYVANPNGSDGMGRRQCTHEYKITPINRKVRELLGAAAPDYKRVPKGHVARQWIGFTTDEIGRVSDRAPAYAQPTYPLIDMGMTRDDCARWLTNHGWHGVAKSACIGCPYNGNARWRALRDDHPDEWADAVEFDEAIRHGGARGDAMRGTAYLHRSRVPLSIAPIDWRSQAALDLSRGQPALFDPDEDGDPDGCSPYGCRSGAPTTDEGDT